MAQVNDINWGPERVPTARLKWCAMGPFCPVRLVALLGGGALGRTAVLRRPKGIVTLTVIGGAREREFAASTLVPVLLECVRVLEVLAKPRPVHVTYCSACPARVAPPRAGDVLSSEHINGGVCMGTEQGVLVFRRQDAEKVLIHELLHLYGVDASLRTLSAAVEAHVVRPCTGLWGHRNGSLPVHLSEAYTDAIACLVFCGDSCRAQAVAVSRAARVLTHFNMGKVPFKEATHVFSYYIVKAALLVHHRSFVSMLNSFDTTLMPTVAEVPRVVGFMGACLRSSSFRRAVTGCIDVAMQTPLLAKAVRSHTQSVMDLSMTDGRKGRIRFSEVGVLI